MGQFRTKKYIDEFIEWRKNAELNIKINLNEEIKLLNKWISEYE